MSVNDISHFQNCFIWKIVNLNMFKCLELFRMNGHIFTAKIKSESPSDQRLILNAHLYHENPDSITVNLIIDEDNMSIRNCKYSVGIIGKHGYAFHSETKSFSFDHDIIGCFYYSIHKDKLEDKAVSFPDKSLILKFDLHDVEIDFSATQKFVESNFSVDRIYFNYFVECLQSLSPMLQTFECPVSSKYTMFVFRLQEDIKIEIKHHHNYKTFLKEVAIKITLFDVDGSEIYSRWYTMKFTKLNNLYQLQPSIPIGLILKRKSKDKKEITFNLLCELHDFNCEKECVISANYTPQNFLSSYNSNNCHKLSNIQKDLLGLFTKVMIPDIKLEAGDTIFQAHRIILSARSPILGEILENRDLKVVKIPDVDTSTLETFLKFLYSGIVESLDYETAIKLLFLSNRYQVNSLKGKCSSFLKKILSEKHISPVTK